MTQAELNTQLKTTKFSVAYNHFIVDDNNPPPPTPYIVFLRTFDNNISSDFKVHGKFKNYQIELYTNIKDLESENKVEQVINLIDTDYETFETYIESDNLYQVVYQIKILEK
jgi:hypothetical protein